MSLINIYTVYESLPRIIQIFIDSIYFICPNSIKFGLEYSRYKHKLKRMQNKTLEEKQREMYDELKRILIFSYENSDFYHKRFDCCSFNPYLFSSSNELQKIPVLRKEEVLENISSILIDCKKLKHQGIRKITTGGTTGKQMVIYEQKRFSEARELAYFDFLFKKVGYTKYCTMAVIRNNALDNGRLWKRDYRNNNIIFNPFLLNDENIKKILDYLNKKKLMYFHVYPSTIYIITKYMCKTGYRLNYKPRAIFASSESFKTFQRELIESTFGCKVYIHYGHSEKGCVAGWCLESGHYHIEESYGYCELVKNEESDLGEIVTTGFNNYLMPLIRYATGDYASYDVSGKCLQWRVLSRVEGRWKQDMLITADGSRIPLTALNVHVDIFKNVEQYQYYQKNKGLCELLIIQGENYQQIDESMIIYELQKKMGESLKLSLRYVDKLIIPKSGKHKQLVQEISDDAEDSE